MICDRILYVPEYYADHRNYSFPGWSSPEVFGRQAPVSVEYCSGNGAWIVEKALSHPEQDWVAVEIQFERVRKIWSKARNLNLQNLFIVCGEGLTFTCDYAPARSFCAVYVNFPDPWPKARHAKNRLLSPSFFAKLSTACLWSAPLTIVTDHLGYTQDITGAMKTDPLWTPVFPSPHYLIGCKNYGTSAFETLFRSQGKPIHYMQYQNRPLT